MSDGMGRLVFIGGPHRSGTTLLAAALASHPDASGLVGTGVPMDEGQFLQDVYPLAPALDPGRYAHEPAAHLTEVEAEAVGPIAERLRASWGPYWKRPDARLLIEKSPPNMLRTRFLSSVFPDALQIHLVRDPLVVALATQKWSYTSIAASVHHTLKSYALMFRDLPAVGARWIVVRYESLAEDPRGTMTYLVEAAGLDPAALPMSSVSGIRRDANDLYLAEASAPPLTPAKVKVLYRLRSRLRRAGFELTSTASEIAYTRAAFAVEFERLGYGPAVRARPIYEPGDPLPDL